MGGTKSLETNNSHIRDGWQWSILEGFAVTLSFGDSHLAQISESLRPCVGLYHFTLIINILNTPRLFFYSAWHFNLDNGNIDMKLLIIC